jgi:hypothetical protein
MVFGISGFSSTVRFLLLYMLNKVKEQHVKTCFIHVYRPEKKRDLNFIVFHKVHPIGFLFDKLVFQVESTIPNTKKVVHFPRYVLCNSYIFLHEEKGQMLVARKWFQRAGIRLDLEFLLHCYALIYS